MFYAAIVISALRFKMEDHAQPVHMYSLVMLFLFRLALVARMRVRLETRRSWVRPPQRSATFYSGD